MARGSAGMGEKENKDVPYRGLQYTILIINDNINFLCFRELLGGGVKDDLSGGNGPGLGRLLLLPQSFG